MWRYQSVYRKIGDVDSERIEFSVCEVYFDEEGILGGWTESPSMRPYGQTHSELIGDLEIMLADASKWKPVDFDKMHAGMTFELVENKNEAIE